MSSTFVLTLTGADRVGIVEEVTRLLLGRGGNVETSRMARLGGEFAILMLVTMPAEAAAGLDADLQELAARGYKLTTTPTEPTYPGAAHAGWRPYRIEVRGADHEGIIHEVAQYLSRRGISIESLETETARAPVSAAPLFHMTALVAVPPDVPGDWEAELEARGHPLNLEIAVAPAEGP